MTDAILRCLETYQNRHRWAVINKADDGENINKTWIWRHKKLQTRIVACVALGTEENGGLKKVVEHVVCQNGRVSQSLVTENTLEPLNSAHDHTICRRTLTTLINALDKGELGVLGNTF